MFLFLAENAGFLTFAIGQRQMLLSVCGFIAMLLLTFAWRRQAAKTLLTMWLIFWGWLFVGLLPVVPGAVHRWLPIERGWPDWLPVSMLNPCGIPFSQRLSGDMIAGIPLLTWNVAILVLWMTVVSWRGRALYRRRRSYRRIACRAQPVHDIRLASGFAQWLTRYRMNKAVHLCHSNECDQAFTIGWRRPIVFIPDLFLNHLNVDELDAVLGHELAHVKRRDDLFVCAQQLLKLLFFFNPLVLLSNRRIGELREQCCDMLAIRASGLSPSVFGHVLVRVAELYRHAERRPDVVAGLTSSLLSRRIAGLLQPRTIRFSWLPAAATALVLTAMSMLLSTERETSISEVQSRLLLQSLGAVSPVGYGEGVRNFTWSSFCILPPDKRDYHPGVDFFAVEGRETAVRAIADGRVTAAYSPSLLGGYIVQLTHGDRVVSTYFHLNSVKVKRGDIVRTGQPIAILGPQSDGKHLHVEIRRGNQLLNTNPLVDL